MIIGNKESNSSWLDPSPFLTYDVRKTYWDHNGDIIFRSTNTCHILYHCYSCFLYHLLPRFHILYHFFRNYLFKLAVYHIVYIYVHTIHIQYI